MANVLFVDDDPSVRRANERLFRARGHNVTLAGDGVEALAILASNSGIDILFTDFNMPNMDGFTLAATVRTDERYTRYSSLPIIGIGDFPENKRAPILTEYMPKTCDSQELLNCIARYCR